jgi:hypothetical protein
MAFASRRLLHFTDISTALNEVMHIKKLTATFIITLLEKYVTDFR